MTTLFETSRKETPPELDGGWDYEFVELLNRGVDKSQRGRTLESGQLAEAKNVRFDKTKVVKDYGYKKFAGLVRGNPRLDFQFFKRNGSSQLVLVTNETFYTYVIAVDQWQYVSDGTSTTLSGNEAAGQTVLSVADETGFSANDYVGIILNDDTQWQTTVASTAAGTITVDDPLPSAADSGNAVVKAPELTGSDANSVSITTWAATDKLYMANGNDTPKQFDGVALTDISNLPGTTFVCHIVAVFGSYLLLMRSQEDGSDFPQRVRWSNPGVDNNWNASVNFRDLYETEDFIKASEVLGPYNIIYKERSIYRQEFVGTAELTFRFTEVVVGEGALSADSVINLDAEHLFFGNSNIYYYRGGFDIEPSGDEVYDVIFGQSGELNVNESAKVFAVYVEEEDEALFFYPAGGDTFARRVARVKLSTNAWSFRDYTPDVIGFGFYRAQDTLIWQTAPGTWQDYKFAWNAKQLQASAPTLHLCVSGEISNLMNYSEGIDNSTHWEVVNSSVSANSTTAPDGETTADTLVEDNTNDYHGVKQDLLSTLDDDTIYNFSVYAKDNGRQYLNLSFPLKGAGWGETIFDLVNGTIIYSDPDTISVSMESAANGFYRCSMTANTRSGSVGNRDFGLNMLNGPSLGNAVYTGDGSSGLIYWGAQLTKGEPLFDYIPTPPTFADGDRVFEIDYITTDDNEAAVDYEIQTKDFYVPNRELRFDRHDFRLAGEDVLVEFSIDGGETFETLGTLSPGPVAKDVHLDRQFTGRSLRYRFTGSKAISFESLGFTYKRESLYRLD